MNQLMPAEVHAVIKSLSDLYVKEETGHGDLNIALERESDAGDGQTKAVRGFVVSFDADTVTLGVGSQNIRHVQVPLSEVVRIVIER
jgi:hypothetical protein